jgi:hypothetical protein
MLTRTDTRFDTLENASAMLLLSQTPIKLKSFWNRNFGALRKRCKFRSRSTRTASAMTLYKPGLSHQTNQIAVGLQSGVARLELVVPDVRRDD